MKSKIQKHRCPNVERREPKKIPLSKLREQMRKKIDEKYENVSTKEGQPVYLRKKECAGCGRLLSHKAFHKRADGYVRNLCRECQSEYNKNYKDNTIGAKVRDFDLNSIQSPWRGYATLELEEE